MRVCSRRVVLRPGKRESFQNNRDGGGPPFPRGLDWQAIKGPPSVRILELARAHTGPLAAHPSEEATAATRSPFIAATDRLQHPATHPRPSLIASPPPPSLTHAPTPTSVKKSPSTTMSSAAGQQVDVTDLDVPQVRTCVLRKHKHRSYLSLCRSVSPIAHRPSRFTDPQTLARLATLRSS